MAASDITATERAEPVAWIEHHKGGDNLVWEPQKNGLRYSPLYLSTSPSQAQGETVCPGCGERPAGLCAECRLTASQHTTDPLIAALYAEQDRAHRYLARAEQAESALAAEKRKAEDAREVMRAWWVSDYECYAGRTAQEAFDAAVKDWGGLDGISETVDDVIEAGASETMDLGEDGEGPIVNIRAHAATMTEPGFMCGIDA